MNNSVFDNIPYLQPALGCDVEFFGERDNEIIGAEKVIKEDFISDDYESKLIKDGIQFEINPSPALNGCREALGRRIQESFRNIQNYFKNNNIQPNFNGTIEVSQKEFDSLSMESKTFGCEPDFNIHNECKVNIKENGSKTKKRTAGGHIHIGINSLRISLNYKNNNQYDLSLLKLIGKNTFSIHDITFPMSKRVQNKILTLTKKELYNHLSNLIDNTFIIPTEINKDNISISTNYNIESYQQPQRLIPLMDLLIGIPSVLLDRDKNAKERRKQYGKAGDFRFQPHGLEYRTLSNFWIKAYPLTSFVMGMSKMAFMIVNNDISNNNTKGQDYIFEEIDKKDIIYAINNNDYKTARDIFLKVEKKILYIGDQYPRNLPLSHHTIRSFKQLIINGYEQYFLNNAFDEWINHSISYYGFENFCNGLSLNNNINEIFQNEIISER
jgi:hypothetical protein